MKANYKKYTLNFKRPSGTSRGVLLTKETFFISIVENNKIGIGECGLLRTLSIDDRPDYEDKLRWVCVNISLGLEFLLKETIEFPSIQFGLETAFRSLHSASPFELFPSKFTLGNESISINGLVWMGDETFMRQQIIEKIDSGFDCIKLKIGSIDFQTELNILKSIRKEFSVSDMQIRVDANGAFKTDEALSKLGQLYQYQIHSIEQPIKAGQFEEMSKLCELTPLPIALDEELIGVFYNSDKEQLINVINPQYIILKPSLIGGIQGSNEWISIANANGVGWWVTSALESNVGLNAIAQWTYTLNNIMPQGLGTGGLFTNNFDSPLEVKSGNLHYNKTIDWNFNLDI